VLFFCFVLLSLVLFPPLSAQQYKLEPIAVPGWDLAIVSSINNRGAMVGLYLPTLPSGPLLGFKRDANGVFEFPIQHPDSRNYTSPLGINDSGVIVGYYVSGAFDFHGFLLTGGPQGTFTTLGRVIAGINNRGDFVGHDDQGGFLNAGGTFIRFRFPGAGAESVSGIAWDRTVIGSFQGALGTVAFIRGPAGKFLAFRIPGASRTVARGINGSAGKIVGYYENASGVHGFVYDYLADLAASDGAITAAVRTVSAQTIDYPGQVGKTYVYGINANGIIVGNVVGEFSFTGTPQP
jgi:hypothetical protein